MDVQCERCRAGYSVDEARVPDPGVKVACTCGHRFLLRKRVLPVVVPLGADDPGRVLPLSELAPDPDSLDLPSGSETEDPAWAREGSGSPRAPPKPPPPAPPGKPRRRFLWVALIAVGLLAVAAAVMLLRRADTAEVPPPAPAPAPVPAPVVPAPAPVPPPVPTPAPPPVEPTPAPAPPAPSGPSAAPSVPRDPAPSPLARARELRNRGRCEEALDLYGQALARDGRNAVALAGRGACYLDLTQYAQAEASFQAALELDPRNAEALFGLAETYRYMGNKADAVTGYERFLAVRPTGDDAAAARKLIQQLKE